jgi:hypothetical protein
MTATRLRAAPRLLLAALVAILLPAVVPALVPGAQAAVHPAPTKARLVRALKTVAFPTGVRPGEVVSERVGGSDHTICGYAIPATLSVSRGTEQDELSVGYLRTSSADKARTFVRKVAAKRSCGDGLRRTTLRGAPRGTAALVLVIPVDDAPDVRLYLAFAATGRTVTVATAGTKKDTVTLLSHAVHAYRRADLA